MLSATGTHIKPCKNEIAEPSHQTSTDLEVGRGFSLCSVSFDPRIVGLILFRANEVLKILIVPSIDALPFATISLSEVRCRFMPNLKKQVERSRALCEFPL